jgi:Putative transposase/Transposase zinc-binding domain
VSRLALEVADVFRRYGAAYRDRNAGHLSRGQRKVMGAVEACRTAALGGHVERCGDCGHTVIAFNSCRNRHCPKCQAGAARDWLAARQADLLEVAYFHVVFTLPAPIAAIAYQNKAVVYGMLFEAASETLRTIARDAKHLGAEIGVTMVLHTWGQTLTHHPHVHCIVPGGGLSPDNSQWIACRPGFFLSVRVLSRLFRRLFLEKLTTAHKTSKLRFFGNLAALADSQAFVSALAPLRRAEWVVFAKRPFARPEQVLAYLSRYTHRIAISNTRLVAIDDDKVTFTWKDYRKGSAANTMTLSAGEFMRRFLLHVLPDGFQRIRHYGFLANGHRKTKIALIRKLLDAVTSGAAAAINTDTDGPAAGAMADAPTCPCCGGTMAVIEILPGPRRTIRSPVARRNDTS